jgi:hypothetical protein
MGLASGCGDSVFHLVYDGVRHFPDVGDREAKQSVAGVEQPILPAVVLGRRLSQRYNPPELPDSFGASVPFSPPAPPLSSNSVQVSRDGPLKSMR